MKILAAVAHPDDIEFVLAGTLLRLREAGCEIHFWNLCNGSLGTASLSRQEIASIRLHEARESAELAGAVYHPPLFEDLEVFYDLPSILRVSAVIREIQPDVILTHYPSDYMEDHQNTCRLVLSGAFCREMSNHQTDPERPPFKKEIRVYHAMPHGLSDFRGREVDADFYIQISEVLDLKRKLLACHRSQKEWLDLSQGMDAYIDEMVRLSEVVGKKTHTFQHAEALVRHHHIGYCSEKFDPLPTLLAPYYQAAH